MKFNITESERNEILKMYGLLIQEETPYQKLIKCKYTSDGKYVIYEGKAYSCESGDELPINEAWTLSDILHAGGDLVSAGLDFVIPGTGAVVDTLNALSYIIEAEFKPEEERSALYIMAAITAAFVVVPNALQTIAIPLKQAIKTGKNITSPVMIQGVKQVAKIIDKILLGFPTKVAEALKSPLATKIIGKWGNKISGIINRFTKSAKRFFDDILVAYNLKSGVKTATKTAAKEATLSASKRLTLLNFFKRSPKIKKASTVLRKAGFVPGRVYRYMGPKGMTTGTIKSINNDLVTIVFKNGATTTYPATTFIRGAIGAPWSRKGTSVLVPLFIKRFSDMLLYDGSDIDYYRLDQFEDLDPDMVSQETLSYMSEEISPYQGDTKQYTINPRVMVFQKALQSLGYTLPKYGADGKFGPETQMQLKQFQTDAKLVNSLGKMDRITAKVLSQLLEIKKIEGSEDLQAQLNSL